MDLDFLMENKWLITTPLPQTKVHKLMIILASLGLQEGVRIGLEEEYKTTIFCSSAQYGYFLRLDALPPGQLYYNRFTYAEFLKEIKKMINARDRCSKAQMDPT